MDLHAAPDGVVGVAGPATAFYDLPLGADGMLVGVRLRPGAVVAVIGAPTAVSASRSHGTLPITGSRSCLAAGTNTAGARLPGSYVALLEARTSGSVPADSLAG
jgi:hypothetical protein